MSKYVDKPSGRKIQSNQNRCTASVMAEITALSDYSMIKYLLTHYLHLSFYRFRVHVGISFLFQTSSTFWCWLIKMQDTFSTEEQNTRTHKSYPITNDKVNRKCDKIQSVLIIWDTITISNIKHLILLSYRHAIDI